MKKIIKSFSVFFISLFMLFTLFGCTKDNAIVKEVNTVKGELTGKTVILHTNDIHGGYIPDENNAEQDGGLEGYAAVATIKKDFEAKGATVILVDDGDFSQGSVYVSLNKGAAATELMNKAGYDVVALGNHEFDYGLDTLVENCKDKSFKLVCTNLTEDGKNLFDSDAVFKIDKLKIGFFGLLTPETQTKVNPNFVKRISFPEKEKLFEIAQKEIDALKKKCDIVICLSHLGTAKESTGNMSTDLYANTTGIDFIIDGHSHDVFEKGPNGEPIQTAGTKAANIGVIVIDNSSKQIEKNYLLPLLDVKGDEEVLSLARSVMSEIDKEYGAVFANAEYELIGEKAIVRSQETNLGDLIADAMKWEVLKAGSIDVDDDHVLAVTNGGGIRASIGVGGVTMKDINTVLPFGNTLAVDYITGSELLESLEASTFCTPETIGGFPQVSGINFTVDTTIAYDQGSEYPESTYFKPNSIKRVSIQSINGQPFDENATYAVVTNNFCAAGGDTYYSFKRAYDAGKGFDTGIVLDEAVMDFINEKLEGKIDATYKEPQGRILIVVE